MKVLQTIGGFGAKSGGTSSCTYSLLSAIHRVEPSAQVDILTPDANNPEDPLMGNGEDWIKTVPYDYRTPLSLSRNMTNWLQESDYQLYQTNGLWMHINHATCELARSRNCPYVITPHGMLYPEALQRSAWKKWPLRKLWFNRDVMKASALHATCETEMQHLRSFGYRGPIAIIGNPVDIPEYTSSMAACHSFSPDGILRLGFLGRLHPIKQIENLLQGSALSKIPDLEILIIGKGDDAYEQFLRNEAKRLGIADRVKFLGFLNGREKFEQLARLDALFVPSDMENFGMIIPEALIVGTPVMASLGTPWQVLNSERCGWWTDASPQSIADVIFTLSSLTPDEHKAMGQRGRDYILRTYASEMVASHMLSLYRWLLGKAPKPDFVSL